MDPIQPVGAMIQPPNPNQGLNAYSTLLGIQSQRLGIQQQQQGLQGQAAVVSQEQQKNQELQQAHQTAVQGALNGEDRLITAKKISAIGPYAQSMASSLLSQANEVVQNRQAIQNLTVAQKSEIGNTIQSLVQDPDLSQSKFIDEIERLRSQHPNDPDFSRLLTSTTALAINKDDTQPQLRSKLSQMWGALSGQQQAKPSMVDVGGKIQPGETSVLTGQFTPSGSALGKSLAPQVVNPPGGVPTVVGGPGGGGGGGGKNLSGFPGPQPTDQDMASFGKYQENLNARAAAAADTVPRINLIEQAINAGQGGGGSKTRAAIAQKLQAMGAPQQLVDAVGGGNLAGMQEAEKMLFQTTLAGLKQSMQGDSAHVAQFQAAESVFPNVDTDPRARQKILGFIRDQSSRDFAEQQALNDAKQKGTFSPVTWQADYQKRLRGGQVPGVPGSQVPRSITRTGMHNGRKVAQYSDGSIEYTD